MLLEIRSSRPAVFFKNYNSPSYFNSKNIMDFEQRKSKKNVRNLKSEVM